MVVSPRDAGWGYVLDGTLDEKQRLAAEGLTRYPGQGSGRRSEHPFEGLVAGLVFIPHTIRRIRR